MFQSISQEVDSKQTLIEGLQRQGEGVLREISRREREALQQKIQGVQVEHQRLQKAATVRLHMLNDAVTLRESFHRNEERVLMWVQEKEGILKTPPQCRLAASDMSNQIEKLKVCVQKHILQNFLR